MQRQFALLQWNSRVYIRTLKSALTENGILNYAITFSRGNVVQEIPVKSWHRFCI